MSQKKPNKFIAPLVIAGITVGFLASAYKFVFTGNKKQTETETEQQSAENSTDQQDIQEEK